MGSLRNPVGPLPSSIYWRRRAVAMSLVALLTLLVVWAVASGGGSGGGPGKNNGGDDNGPVPSITPGPSSSGPAISERPGGRDETDPGGGNGGSGGGDGGEENGGGTGGGAGDGGAGSSGEAGSGGGGGGDGVPAGSSLPDCGAGSLDLALRSVKNTYDPDEKPRFELTAKNSSGKDCKVDFGRKSAVITISSASDDEVWASDDCEKDGGQLLLQVPAKGETERTVEWNRRPSSPECATPSAGPVKAGTYLVEAKVEGAKTARAAFSLAKG